MAGQPESLISLSPLEKETFLEAAADAGRWYMNNQNTPENLWGNIRDSADKGRFIYEYYPARDWARGNGVWGQALGIMGLLALRNTEEFRERGKAFNAAKMAGEYLLSLQVHDTRNQANHGGFREHTPQDTESYPRDAATGGMGLIALYKETGDERYLQAALDFAEWYMTYGSDDDGWPYISFDFSKGCGTNVKMEVPGEEADEEYVAGDWQAGGGLFYFYLSAVTGDNTYIKNGLEPMMERLLHIYQDNPPEKREQGYHGEVSVSTGNDDFALVTMMAMYEATGEKQYLETAVQEVKRVIEHQAENGAFPSFGGTFVTGITLLNAMETQARHEAEYDSALSEPVEQCAKFGLTLQNITSTDPRIYGGLYGQSNYGVSRNRIHHRSTGYSLLFNLRMRGGSDAAPYYSSLGWMEE